MTYSIKHSDPSKNDITVYDNTVNTETSLAFPGRTYAGYGRLIAENFLHLLENFAGEAEPTNPTEGQLWYDSATGTLMIYDGGWKSASSIHKSGNPPSIPADKIGEIWVDTVKQQMYIWSGDTWVLVGPDYSTESGLRTGPIIESINDSDNIQRRIIKFLVDEVPVAIFSKDSFTPKISITGFISIKSGLNISSVSIGDGSFMPKLYGTAQNADALNIGNVEIPASKFLRSDVVNTTEYGLNVRNNSGITLGVDGTFKLTTSVSSSKIYNALPGSSIDLQVNRNGSPTTILKIVENKVGINVESPTQELEVDGNIGLTGNLIISNTDASINFNSGSIKTAGGAAISKNLLIGSTLEVGDTSTLKNVLPRITDSFDLGSSTQKWNTVFASTIQADTLIGNLSGDILGNARTATSLQSNVSLKIRGDIETGIVTFRTGGSHEFVATLTTDIIESKEEPFPNRSTKNDTVLVFRSGSGLIKETRDVFVGDLGVPVGTILPFAGQNVPYGYLLCDGSEVERSKYSDLYDVIGFAYGVASLGVNTFRLPDLRGRFPLGRDNMDNGGTVPNSSGGYVDAGGGNVDRITGTDADTLGGAGGSDTTTLEVKHLPDHEHNLKPPGVDRQFSVVRLDSAVVAGTSPGPGAGPTAPGQAQYLNTSGGIKTTVTLGRPLGVLNPFLTINYIIRSGPPAF